MFGIGMPELFLILIIALVVVGPDKLPDLVKAIGKGIGEFRKATSDIKDSFDQDGELRNLKETLTQARDEMTGMIRKETAGLNPKDIVDSIQDGTFLEKTGVGADSGKTKPSTGSAPGAESDSPATPKSVADTDQSRTDKS